MAEPDEVGDTDAVPLTGLGLAVVAPVWLAVPDADNEAPVVGEPVFDALDVVVLEEISAVLDGEEASEVPFVVWAEVTLLLTAADADAAVVAAEPVAFRDEVGRVPV